MFSCEYCEVFKKAEKTICKGLLLEKVASEYHEDQEISGLDEKLKYIQPNPAKQDMQKKRYAVQSII